MRIFILALLGCFFIASPSVAQDTNNKNYEYETGYSDPMENVNRAILGFNDGLDRFVFHPFVTSYRFVVPAEGRQGVTNFLRNLRSPIDLANQLLQGDLQGSWNVVFRFVTNSLAGFGGFLDVAGREGWTYESEDFGQTLAKWGVPDGPYVVMPIFGPASMRDAFGYGVDGLADPITRYYFNTDEDHIAYKYNIAQALEMKNQLYNIQRDLDKNSLDKYSSLKTIVYQNRQAEIADRARKNQDYLRETSKTTSSNASYAVIPDYDEDF